MSRGDARTRLRLPILLTAVVVTVALSGCSTDDTADPLSGCDRDSLRISEPVVLSGDRRSQMGMPFISHRSCGFNADGSGYLGGFSPVVPVADTLEIQVPAGFTTSYSLAPFDQHIAELTEVATDDHHTFAIDVPDPGCYDLVVDLVDGDHQGRWESRLDVVGEGVRPRAPEHPRCGASRPGHTALRGG